MPSSRLRVISPAYMSIVDPAGRDEQPPNIHFLPVQTNDDRSKRKTTKNRPLESGK
jgi:hypothetical protein